MTEIERIKRINRRFNEELDAFSRGTQEGNLHLGLPSEALRCSGLNGTEMFITPKVLKDHLEKHGLTIDDIRNLPIALQNPLLVYEWGTKAKSLIAITEMPHGDSRITVAVKLIRGGQRVEVNELASIHAKEVDRFLWEMEHAQMGGLKDALRWVGDKKKALEWLGLVPPKGTASLNTQERFLITNVIENFENPKFVDMDRERRQISRPNRNRGPKL